MAEPSADKDEITSIKEKDLILPTANITRLMRSVLPPGPTGSKLASDAKQSMQELLSEFILFITQEAAENAVNSNKKTISGDGIVPAFSSLGMRNYAFVLNAFLTRYREKYVTPKAEGRETTEAGAEQNQQMPGDAAPGYAGMGSDPAPGFAGMGQDPAPGFDGMGPDPTPGYAGMGSDPAPGFGDMGPDPTPGYPKMGADSAAPGYPDMGQDPAPGYVGLPPQGAPGYDGMGSDEEE